MSFSGAIAGLRLFTRAEDRALRRAYAAGGIAAALAACPSRSRSSILHRAQRLGVRRRRRWTWRDDDRLRDLWGEHTVAQIARALERTELTVYWRAQTLGLGLGCPQGFEYLSHAAARTGYATGQLRRILRWAGVGVRPACTRLGPRRRPTHIVDPDDVDDAVARWHATETIEAAARRHDLSAEAMIACLEAAGVQIRVVRPEHRLRPGGRLHRRVTTADVDGAVAARATRYATTESLRQASRRVGIGHGPLGRWLREAGLHTVRRRWRVLPAEVDRVVALRRRRPTCRARLAQGQ